MSAVLKSQLINVACSIKMSAEDYHKRPELSNSGNNILVDQTPAHFVERLKTPWEPSASQQLGTMVHSATLEPDKFCDTHAVMPTFTGFTQKGELTTSLNCKEVKDKREEWAIKNAGKVIMEQDQYDRVFGMLGAVMAHKASRDILTKSYNEASFFGELDGVKVRCRPDIVRAGRLIADLKTTAEEASYKSFFWTVRKYSYARQAAFYADLVSQVTGELYDSFSFIVVETKPPYGVQVFTLDSGSLDFGREQYKRGLEVYRKCLETNEWPAYSSEAVPMSIFDDGSRG